MDFVSGITVHFHQNGMLRVVSVLAGPSDHCCDVEESVANSHRWDGFTPLHQLLRCLQRLPSRLHLPR